MTGLASFANAPHGGSTYAWNEGGTDGALDLDDSPFSGASDLGNPNRTAWADATRTYLSSNPDVNVIMWSWCGQADGSEADIQTYLDLMSQLEEDYPGCVMGHHGSGCGTHSNQQIGTTPPTTRYSMTSRTSRATTPMGSTSGTRT